MDDKIRTPSWYYGAYCYLANRFPLKYELVRHSYFEGMVYLFGLKEIKTKELILPIIRENRVSNCFSFFEGDRFIGER